MTRLSWAVFVAGIIALVAQTLLTPRLVEREVAQAAPRIIQAALKFPPPMVIHGITMRNATVARGKPLEIEYLYDKRAECTPELGTGRHIYYAFVYGTDRFYLLEPFKSADREPSGANQIATSSIETVTLPPGTYSFQMMSKFSCSGQSAEGVVQSDLVPFAVIPAS